MVVEVVIVDDIEFFSNKIESIIKKQLCIANIENNTYKFNDYNSDFWKIAKNKNKKVYILDIETKSANGIDIARKIRNNDFNYIILFVTAYDTAKYKSLILAKINNIFGFIEKTHLEEQLTDKIKYLIKTLKQNNYILNIKNSKSFYNLPISEIDYITVDKINHKTIIFLSNRTYEKINLPLTKVENELHNYDNFFKTHRCCIININNIRKVNYKNCTIKFISENETTLFSRLKKEELKKKLD